MKYVLIGKIVNTHGLKGEVRILSEFRYKDRVFVPGMKIYIGKDKQEEEIVSYRHHKIFEMIMIKGYYDIDEVLKYKGEYVFVNKEDTIRSCEDIISGKYDSLPEAAFLYVGTIDDVVKKAEQLNG